jgi:hypothetical protein
MILTDYTITLDLTDTRETAISATIEGKAIDMYGRPKQTGANGVETWDFFGAITAIPTPDGAAVTWYANNQGAQNKLYELFSHALSWTMDDPTQPAPHAQASGNAPAIAPKEARHV